MSPCLSVTSLSLCPLVYLPVSQSTCKLVSVMPTPFLSFTPRNLYFSPPSLTPSLVHSSWPSVSATMPDCGTEKIMKRECLHSLRPLWDCWREQHNSEEKSNGTHSLASDPCKRIFVLTTTLPPQLPGSATGQYDPGAQHRQECCSPRECLYDGNLH